MSKDIRALGTGKLSVNGVGRVGEYATAKRAGRSRARKYWAIFEFIGPGVGSQERTEFGKFKTKRLANTALLEFAKLNGYKATTFGGDPNIESYISVDMSLAIDKATVK